MDLSVDNKIVNGKTFKKILFISYDLTSIIYRVSLNSPIKFAGFIPGFKTSQSVVFIAYKSPSLSVQPPFCFVQVIFYFENY